MAVPGSDRGDEGIVTVADEAIEHLNRILDLIAGHVSLICCAGGATNSKSGVDW
jgi:hypothetical protein